MTPQGHVVDAAEGGLGRQPVDEVGIRFAPAVLQRRQHRPPAGQGHAGAPVQAPQGPLDPRPLRPVQLGRLVVEDVLQMPGQGQKRGLDRRQGLGRRPRRFRHGIGHGLERALHAELGPAIRGFGRAGAQLIQGGG